MNFYMNWLWTALLSEALPNRYSHEESFVKNKQQ